MLCAAEHLLISHQCLTEQHVYITFLLTGFLLVLFKKKIARGRDCCVIVSPPVVSATVKVTDP